MMKIYRVINVYYMPLVIWYIIYFLPINKQLKSPDEKSLMFIERNLFGNPCFEYIDTVNNIFFTIASGILYLFHYVSPIIHLYYLHKNGSYKLIKKYVKMLGYGNLVSLLIHILSPTAPPWVVENRYYDKYWYPEARLEDFDNFFGIKLFHSIYKHNPMKYASFPSLHVLWITNMMFIMFNKYTLTHSVLIWISTIYLHHHFIIDGIMSLIISSFCFIFIK